MFGWHSEGGYGAATAEAFDLSAFSKAAQAAGLDTLGDVRAVGTTGSTNADALALLDDPATGALTLVADHQTEGRGRKGRSWIERPGSGLLFTTILPDALPREALWVVPFWCALALDRALVGLGVHARLVWPNDILLDTNKVAGILCVSRVQGDRARVACGMGINVHRYPEAADIEPAPAFIDDANSRVTREALLAGVLRAMQDDLALLGDAPEIAMRWTMRAIGDGQPYRVLVDGETEPLDGIAIGLGAFGSLMLRTANGAVRSIDLADARVLR